MKALTITSITALLLCLMILVTAGFAIIDLWEGDSWVGSIMWWKRLIAGIVGAIVVITTMRFQIRSSRSHAMRTCLIASTVNLFSGAVLASLVW